MVLVHGDAGRADSIARLAASQLPGGFCQHLPHTPPFGVHHTKGLWMSYEGGVRMVVTTANLLYGGARGRGGRGEGGGGIKAAA